MFYARRNMLLVLRKLKIIFIIFVLFFFLIFLLSRGHIYDKTELEYGITFSKKQALDLNLNWQETYLAILDQLEVKKLRLSAYWNEIEPENNNYTWDDLDWQIEQAEQRKLSVIFPLLFSTSASNCLPPKLPKS